MARIKEEYDKLKKIFEKAPQVEEVTNQLITIYSLCREILDELEKKQLYTENCTDGKNYIVFF